MHFTAQSYVQLQNVLWGPWALGMKNNCMSIVCAFMFIPFIPKVFFFWCRIMVNIIMLIIYSCLVYETEFKCRGDTICFLGPRGCAIAPNGSFGSCCLSGMWNKMSVFSVSIEKEQDDQALTKMQYASETWRRKCRSLICRICKKKKKDFVTFWYRASLVYVI